MVIVVEGLTGKNASAKVTYGTSVSGGMTDNAYYSDTTGVALVAELNTATGNLKTANGTKDTANINLMVTAFDNAIKAIVLYVQGKLIGIPDEQAIVMVESAKLGYKKQGKPIYADLEAKAGEAPLSVVIRKKVTTKKKNVAYVFQVCNDPATEEGYATCMISTHATVTITVGLKPQTKYWYRVATVEGQVMSEFSAPVSFTTS